MFKYNDSNQAVISDSQNTLVFAAVLKTFSLGATRRQLLKLIISLFSRLNTAPRSSLWQLYTEPYIARSHKSLSFKRFIVMSYACRVI